MASSYMSEQGKTNCQEVTRKSSKIEEALKLISYKLAVAEEISHDLNCNIEYDCAVNSIDSRSCIDSNSLDYKLNQIADRITVLSERLSDFRNVFTDNFGSEITIR